MSTFEIGWYHGSMPLVPLGTGDFLYLLEGPFSPSRRLAITTPYHHDTLPSMVVF